ncbi:putative protein kinase [Trypanosoma rangeli]|uniref:Uncharacterized protein n=1 Tax=Trypanosoma rangeli TaxID=5698 RepID=A0A3R7KTA7_TRYRA|nr:putative protein kinase [Trypanosoma rangeli]RNF09263.1 putative protein kinase [Trypanosoma rangeli]|eukprot:RNF09263.1 putative protein kinase [Trypanosoma rangeli]
MGPIECSMGKLYGAFAHLSRPQLERVPLYVNDHSDVDVATEKHTFLLERYSSTWKLQQVVHSMNDLLLVLRQFRKLFSDAMLHKKFAVKLKVAVHGDTTVLRTLRHHPVSNLGTLILVWISSLQKKPRLNWLITLRPKKRLAHSAAGTNAADVALQREALKGQVENEISQGYFNTSEIHTSFRIRLRAGQVTVVTKSLSCLAAYMYNDMQYCHYFLQRFLSLVTELIKIYNGISTECDTWHSDCDMEYVYR